jgi:hypothetical protein
LCLVISPGLVVEAFFVDVIVSQTATVLADARRQIERQTVSGRESLVLGEKIPKTFPDDDRADKKGKREEFSTEHFPAKCLMIFQQNRTNRNFI